MPGEFVARQGLISRGNVVVTGSLTTSGSLTATGTITATTLVVQTVTSSISSITGSTNFGSLSSNTHTFTGSINASGSGNFSGSLTASSTFTLDGTKKIFLRSNQGTGGGLISGSAIGAMGNFSIYSDDGVAGDILGMYYWNGGTYRSALQFANVSSGNSNLILMKDGGNVGIGKSAPDYLLDLYGTGANTTRVRVTGTTNFSLLQAQNDSGALYLGIDSSTGGGFSLGNYSRIIWSTGAYPLLFVVNDAERMRITANGEVLMNTSNTLTAGWLCISVNSNNYNAIVLRDIGTSYSSGNYYQLFTNSTNQLAGGIAHTAATTVNYGTSSDYRLKEDLKDFNGLEILSNIKFYDFKWKNEDIRMHGVIAHELKPFIPLAVNGIKDAIDKEGNIVAQGVDYSKIVPVIGKALQEAMTRIEQLEAKVIELENK